MIISSYSGSWSITAIAAQSLKPRTKDCDLVISDERSFNHIVETLKKMGYTSINKSRLSADDQRIAASEVPALVFACYFVRDVFIKDRQALGLLQYLAYAFLLSVFSI